MRKRLGLGSSESLATAERKDITRFDTDSQKAVFGNIGQMGEGPPT